MAGWLLVSSSPGRHVLLDLSSEPLYPLLQPLPCGGIAGADVPGLVQEPLKAWSEELVTRTHVALLKSFEVTFVGNNNYRACEIVLSRFCTFHLGFVTPSHWTSHL